MLISPKGQAKLYRVWLQQGGRCCACLKPVTKDTPWHSRHVVKLSHGGTDAAANLEIYHLRCPRDVQFANVDDVQPSAQ
jgi:RNA-directed DNA polymerase